MAHSESLVMMGSGDRNRRCTCQVHVIRGEASSEVNGAAGDTTAVVQAHDVDRLADRVAPKKVARRKAGAAQRRLNNWKERVMGSADDPQGAPMSKAQDVAHSTGDLAGQAQDAVRNTADQVGRSVKEAPDRMTKQTQASPPAAGVIAFGAGMLAAALLPATEAEERIGSQLREHSGELLQPVKETAQEVAQDLKTRDTPALYGRRGIRQEHGAGRHRSCQRAGSGFGIRGGDGTTRCGQGRRP
ncbi:hypothetical protein ACFY8O_13970 [Streptomyces argenteolus]|uniref:DUF3618 domain-containing protein n=1 Tax=Streptomyces argenteolus TaxID=67274 RepID=A0ABW6X4K5_9ACTN